MKLSSIACTCASILADTPLKLVLDSTFSNGGRKVAMLLVGESVSGIGVRFWRSIHSLRQLMKDNTRSNCGLCVPV